MVEINAKRIILRTIPFVLGLQVIAADRGKQPNILFILADDFGWNQLGCNGDKHVQTPHLDKLASEGIRFTRAYVMPQSSPTRGAFFTGKYPGRSRMTAVTHAKPFSNGYMVEPEPLRAIPVEWYNITRMLKDAGYITGISGKWHIGGNYSVQPMKSEMQGRFFERYGIDWAGDANETTDNYKAVDAITNEICTFMETNKDRPFFVWASHFTTHSPLAAPDSLIRKYESLGYKRSTDIWGNTDERPTADFLAMTEFLDTSVGRLLDKLETLGLRENTLVVFVGDNGALGRYWDHSPLRGAKGSLYEGGIRSPLIMRLPGEIAPREICSVPVHIVDLYPTFMELSGGSKPENYVIDGRSLVPLWTNGEAFGRETIFFHHPHYEEMYSKTPSSAIIDGDYKLIHSYGDYYQIDGFKEIHKVPYGKLIKGERFELFNLKEDPQEQNNIVEYHPEIKKRLNQKLTLWLNEIEALLPQTK
ncbi:MAG: sulfatase [Tannerella sp.]|jgi:uncharacterized sulfatase|nr:sulfatase [Tannerella sp.]